MALQSFRRHSTPPVANSTDGVRRRATASIQMGDHDLAGGRAVFYHAYIGPTDVCTPAQLR